MNAVLTKEIEDEIIEAKRMARVCNWWSGVLTAVGAIATAAATITSAIGLGTDVASKALVASLAAIPGLALALQRTQRLDARTAWHTERMRRLQALQRARAYQGVPDADSSNSMSELELELEARWQAAHSRDADGKQVFTPMPSPIGKVMLHAAKEQQESAAVEIQQRLAKDDLIDTLARADDKTAVKASLAKVARDIVNATKEKSSLTVELPTGETEIIPVAAAPSFDLLTDLVYFMAKPHFPPYTYGTRWRLVNMRTHEALRHAREISGLGPGKPVRDNRTLKELGVEPGDKLKVESLASE